MRKRVKRMSYEFHSLSVHKGWRDLSSKKHLKIVFKKKHPDVYSWRRVWMEWNAQTMGLKAGSRCASPLKTTAASASAAQGITHHFLVLPKQWKDPWMEWVVSVCPTFILEQCYLLLIFSWDLRLKLRAEPRISVDWRETEPWKKKRQQKEKESRDERGKNYSSPKYWCVGKGSVIVPSISYLTVTKFTSGAG